MVTETPCLAHFAHSRVYLVTTEASRTGFGTTPWQKQSDNLIRPTTFTSRYLNDAKKKCSIGELQPLAVV